MKWNLFRVHFYDNNFQKRIQWDDIWDFTSFQFLDVYVLLPTLADLFDVISKALYKGGYLF